MERGKDAFRVEAPSKTVNQAITVNLTSDVMLIPCVPVRCDAKGTSPLWSSFQKPLTQLNPEKASGKLKIDGLTTKCLTCPIRTCQGLGIQGKTERPSNTREDNYNNVVLWMGSWN